MALCAPGKVNAAIAAQAMIDRLGPELILNIGVAGGIGKDVHIGDVVIAASCVEYDFDTSALDGCPAGEMSLPGFEKPLRFLPVNGELAQVLAQSAQGLYGRAHLGVIATGDRFCGGPGLWGVSPKGVWRPGLRDGGRSGCPCVPANRHVPCAVLRTISDNAPRQ